MLIVVLVLIVILIVSLVILVLVKGVYSFNLWGRKSVSSSRIYSLIVLFKGFYSSSSS